MPNITLRVDAEVVKKVRKVAIDQNTTLTQMVRDFLATVAARADGAKRQRIRRLRESFAAYSRDIGLRTWQRDELHER